VTANNLRKDEDDYIYKMSDINPMVYNKYMTHKEFIEIVFDEDKLFNSNPAHLEQILKFIKNRNMKEFTNIKYNKDYLAFRNGSLNIQTMEFIKNEDINIEEKIISRHFINKDFDMNNTDTPLMDSVVYYQLPNKEIVEIFYALIGRLYFEVKNDGLWENKRESKEGENDFDVF